MKNNILLTLVALVATMTMVGCNKIVSMDNIRGYEVVADNRYEVLDMDDNREPLSEAITLRVPDTIGRQGTSGVVPGTLTADIAAGAGFVRDFEFTYNNGEKTFSYSVAGNFAIDYEGTTVWPIHGFTLTGEFSVVSERTTPTYLQVSKVEWTLRAENGAIAAQKASYHKIYEDPKDSVIVVMHDTVWQHVVDTVFIWERDTVTQIIYDTVVMGGDTTSQTRLLVTKHKSWDDVSGGYIWGTDSIIVTTLSENGTVVSRVGGTYQHKTPFSVSGIAGNAFDQEVVGNCYDLNNGHVTVSNHNITVNCGATQVVSPVILDGVNWTNYVHGCGVRGQRICFGSNGIATIHFVDIAGAAAGTTTTTYTVNDTTPTTPLFPNAVGAWASDEYTTAVVTSLSQRITNVIVIEPDGSNYKYFRGVLNAGMTRADFDSVSITATEYTWLTGKIAAGYVPAIVADHNSTAEYRGAVKSEDQNSYWKLTYDIQAGTAYVMSQSAWTISGYNGRNANRGTMNATTGKLVADGVTLQIR